MDESSTEEILIKRLEKRQLVSRADLQEVERIANDRGMRRLARRAAATAQTGDPTVKRAHVALPDGIALEGRLGWSRIFRQPGGFEGFGARQEPHHPDDLEGKGGVGLPLASLSGSGVAASP
jgi:hypothetical protein